MALVKGSREEEHRHRLRLAEAGCWTSRCALNFCLMLKAMEYAAN